MVKVRKNESAIVILLAGVVMLAVFACIDIILYPNEDNFISDTNTEVPKNDESIWGAITGFFGTVVDGLGKVWSVLSGQSYILGQAGVIGTVITFFIWVFIILGLIETLWIG